MKATSKFGQLPLLTIDGKKTVAQSSAMLRYAAELNNKGSLYPADKRLEVDEILGLSDDLQRAWVPALYMAWKPTDFGYPEGFQTTDEGKELIKSLRLSFLEKTLPVFAQYFSDIISNNGNLFLAGSSVTIADCQVLPQLRAFRAGYIDHIPTSCLDAYPVLLAWMERMYALPQLNRYYSKN